MTNDSRVAEAAWRLVDIVGDVFFANKVPEPEQWDKIADELQARFIPALEQALGHEQAQEPALAQPAPQQTAIHERDLFEIASYAQLPGEALSRLLGVLRVAGVQIVHAALDHPVLPAVGPQEEREPPTDADLDAIQAGLAFAIASAHTTDLNGGMGAAADLELTERAEEAWGRVRAIVAASPVTPREEGSADG